MASPESAKKLFEDGVFQKNFFNALDEYVRSVLLGDADDSLFENDGAAIAAASEKIRQLVLGRIGGFLESIIEEMLSDEDVNDLIEMINSPIYKKISGLAGELDKKVNLFLALNGAKIEEEVKKILDAI